MTPGPHVVLTARHQPFEVALLAISWITGVINLLRLAPSPALDSISLAIPFYYYIWGAGLVLGSGAGIASLFLQLPDSLIVERIGLSLLATMFVSYSVAILFVSGGRGMTSLMLVGAFAAGSLARIVRINRDLRLLEEAGRQP